MPSRSLNWVQQVLAEGMDLQTCDDPALARHWLLPAELQHWERYTLAKRRKEWLAGRICAKVALQRLLGGRAAPHRAVLREASGKPALHPSHQGLRPVHLSISHHRARAVAAVHSAPVGIDIECHQALQRSPLHPLIHPQEQALTADQLGCSWEAARTVLWCLKEARFKCHGHGSFVPMASRWRVIAWQNRQPIWNEPSPGTSPPWCHAAGHPIWQVQLHIGPDDACVLVQHIDPFRSQGQEP